MAETLHARVNRTERASPKISVLGRVRIPSLLTGIRVLIAFWAILSSSQVGRSYVGVTVTNAGPVDFNHDGTVDVSFFGLTLETWDQSGEEQWTIGNGETEVLVAGAFVQPLFPGTTVSPTAQSGSWTNAASQRPEVWDAYYSRVGSISYTVGVGGAGYGEFMGVRFRLGSEWHYGWIRFGIIGHEPEPVWPDLGGLNPPSILEYAFETTPDTPIVTPDLS